jgi:ferric-dicitrate binding protein FerR (iron transport regulator)
MIGPGGPALHSRRAVLRLLWVVPLAFASRTAGADVKAIGAVSDVRGIAVAELGSDRRPLVLRAALHLGETLSTGDNSRLKALFVSSATLSLSANARLTIDRFIAGSGGRMALTSGALLIDSATRSLRRGMTVVSPYAIIGTRGTRFFAGELGDNFSVFVAQGAVDVRAAGRTVRLRSGEGTDIETIGAAPGPVKRWGAEKIARAMALVS